MRTEIWKLQGEKIITFLVLCFTHDYFSPCKISSHFEHLKKKSPYKQKVMPISQAAKYTGIPALCLQGLWASRGTGKEKLTRHLDKCWAEAAAGGSLWTGAGPATILPIAAFFFFRI